MSTLHNMMRKEANNNLLKKDVWEKYIAHIEGQYTTTMAKAKDLFQKLYTKTVDWKLVCPIMNMCTSFKLSKVECRNGMTKLITKKN